MGRWDEYWRERIDRVSEGVPMDDLLEDYDIPLRRSDEEVQFPCPLHGDGRDKKFSARYYPSSNSAYCFACKKARDPIEWVLDWQRKREARRPEFSEVVRELESEWGIEPPSPPDVDPEGDSRDREPEALRQLERMAGRADDGGAEEDDEATLDSSLAGIFERFDERVAEIVSRHRDCDAAVEPVLKVVHMADDLRSDAAQSDDPDVGAVRDVVEKMHRKIREVVEDRCRES